MKFSLGVAWTWGVALAVTLGSASPSPCACHNKYCDYSKISSQGRISCYVPGTNPNETHTENTNTGTCTLDDLFAANEFNSNGNPSSCPRIDMQNVEFDVYLEPCAESATRAKNVLSKGKDGIEKLIQAILTPSEAASIWGNVSKCTPMKHEVQRALFTGTSTTDFTKSIFVTSASYYVQQFKSEIPVKAVITRRNIEGDATCNVVIVSMPNTRLEYLELDNTPCLQTVFSNSEEAEDFKNALEDFGPDQLGIVRITAFFAGISPTAFDISYVDLATWKPYRTRYPGRALISVDALRNKVYPPDPITIGTSFFDAILDKHSVPLLVPYSGSTDMVDGSFYCDNSCSPKSLTFASYPLCPNKTTPSGPCPAVTKDSAKAKISCPAGPVAYYPVTIAVAGVITPKCVDNRDIRNGTSCPEGQAYDPRYETCTSLTSNRINSRPIDIVMWDFDGDIIFGSNFDSTNGRIITALIYGDIKVTNVGVLKGAGEAFEDYFDRAASIANRLPDPGLCLLDARDFVSLSAPLCPVYVAC